MSIIGLDLGTTRIKALLHDDEREDFPVVASPMPITTSSYGDLRDAEAVVRVAADCIARLLLSLTNFERARIEGIGIASLSEEVVLTDEHGQSVAAMPAWYTTVMRENSARVGTNPSYSWSKLRWAREHLAAETTRSVRGVTSLAGYVAARFTGDVALSMDDSHASRTGFFHLEERRWDETVFETSGWPATILPTLVSSGTPLGRVAAEWGTQWGMPARAMVAVAGHDHFCAAFAAGVRRPGQVFVSSGTSEAHVLLLEGLVGIELPQHVQTGRFVDGRSFYLHAHLPSGHLHAHLEQLVGGRGRLDELEQHALYEPVGAHGVEFVPHVGADPGYSVRGLSAHAGAATFVRAAQEGMALAAQELDERLIAHAGAVPAAVVATGAATANPLWTQIRAAVGIAPLEVVQEPELTALGAAHVFRAVVLGEDPTPASRRRVAGDPEDIESYRRLRAARIEAAAAAERGDS